MPSNSRLLTWRDGVEATIAAQEDEKKQPADASRALVKFEERPPTPPSPSPPRRHPIYGDHPDPDYIEPGDFASNVRDFWWEWDRLGSSKLDEKLKEMGYPEARADPSAGMLESFWVVKITTAKKLTRDEMLDLFWALKWGMTPRFTARTELVNIVDGGREERIEGWNP